MTKYLRLANYMGAAQLYLKDNFLLKEPLLREHVKSRPLGHWGTVPGINFIYANLNLLAKKHSQNIMLVLGPGHGYPALLANLYIEGSLGEFYPEYKHSKEGFESVIKKFSWPGGFPSHANPETPGVILEGGELGYSLASAYGACFDNPDLLVACIVGDGESETGPLSAAWQSSKFINPKEDGMVLPIVHVNKYKISGPSILGTMSRDEIYDYFYGLGYNPIILDEEYLYEPTVLAMEDAYQQIKYIQESARSGNEIEKPRWPLIVLINKKGWTGPVELDGFMIEDSFRSHGIPLEHIHTDQEEFYTLEKWLKSYNVEELLKDDYSPIDEILSLLPEEEFRLGMNTNANGLMEPKPLVLPDTKTLSIKDYDLRNDFAVGNMYKLSDYLREIIRLNPTNFRVFSPDETESNRLGSLFEVTNRRYYWPVPEGSENISKDGRIMEILSEHTLQAWLEGYTLTGRHGVFITYEAFGMIVASMIDQYTKFLKQSSKVIWRKPVPSLNIVLTSTSWRQDHNGFSHQNPGLISSLLNDYSNKIRIHFPVDANMLLATAQEVLTTTNIVNLIVVGKHPLPQYLSYDEANLSIDSGINAWDFASHNPDKADIIFAATGDVMTKESITAAMLLKKHIPEVNTKFVSVSELTCFGIGDNPNLVKITDEQFDSVFGIDKPVIYAYHGYPEDIKQLIFNHLYAKRFSIHGYQERGTTTTPFDILVTNQASRYDLAIDALENLIDVTDEVSRKAKEVISYFRDMLKKHAEYIEIYGEDIPEIENFKFIY